MTAEPDHIAECHRIRERLSERLGVDLEARRNDGLQRAERFRRDLVSDGRDAVLAEAIVDFVGCVGERHEGLAGRPELRGFSSVTADDIVQAIRGMPGEPLPGEMAFGKFTGRWFGLWGTMRVDHSWDQIDETLPSIGSSDWPRPSSLQFAWVGEAFCWHGAFALPGERPAWVILGTVHHVRGERIDEPVPHVAVPVPGGRLIWITPSHVFCEEVTPDDQYAITGFEYVIDAGRLSIKRNRGFQAVYTRSPSDRPPFVTFRVKGDG